MSCEIHLDNYQGQCFPGTTLFGRVVCVFNSSKTIRGIKLKVKGEEFNQWLGTETYYDYNERVNKTRTVQYSGQNSFFHIRNNLQGEGQIGPGRFEYPFSIQLPVNLPGTYRGHHGGIYYTMEAKVDRPFNVDYKSSLQIMVVAPINFNLIRNQLQMMPVNYSDEKILCCCCCASGPITMEVQLEKEAFVLGEVVKLRVDLSNMSKEDIESIKVKIGTRIESKVTFPHSESKYDFEPLAAGTEAGVGAQEQKTYDFNLLLPRNLVVPNFTSCSLFSKISTLKVTAVMPSFHNNLKITTALTIGHIPLGSEQHHQTIEYVSYPAPAPVVIPAMASAGPSAPYEQSEASASFKHTESTITESPPPSYNEAISSPSKF